jgi:histidinol-phosphate phosphatase family protein
LTPTSDSPDRPTQAVILAGGRGTRLQPLTDTRPKPMIEFHGRPFLEYMVEMLRDQGFERILLLLGYLPDVIRDHFGDGSAFGVEIRYSVTEPDDLTGRRMQVAAPLLDDVFLLAYCDNYWPLRFDDMWRRYTAAGLPCMVTVYDNRDGYSRDNMAVDADSRVRVYDRTRTAQGLAGVEIGYAIVDRTTLDLLPEHDELFEQAVYPPLVERGELLAYVTGHRYYSVGSHERLPLTERFLAREPTIILDRDGTLNERPPRAEYVRTPGDFRWLPGSLDALRLLADAGYRIVVVSNQAGIARGAMTEADLDAVSAKMLADATAAGVEIAALYHCPHGWDEGCECRKPRPGMLLQAQRDFDLDLSRTYFMGDDERDGQAAAAAGCPFAFVSEDAPLLAHVRALLAGTLEPNPIPRQETVNV